MKQTSIDKLSEVYNALRDPENSRINNAQAAEMIQQVIRAEAITPAKAGKFNLYNYVTDDEIRPAMNGVFHDRGNKVASDTHILIAIKEDYPAEYEGAVLLKDGSYVESLETVWDAECKKNMIIRHRTAWVDKDGHNHPIYPKWESVVPSGDGYKPYEFDTQKFYDWVEQKRAAHKTETGKGIKFGELWSVRIGPCLLKASMFDKLVAAMNYLGATQLFVQDARRSVYAATDKGLVLLMPFITDVQDEDIVTLA